MLIGIYNAQYIGKTMCGFKKAHEYCIEIDKDLYGYKISGILNLTEDAGNSAYIRYSSENSLRKNWIFDDINENVKDIK